MSNRALRFAELCNDLKLSIAVEVGVHQGVFTTEFCSHWKVPDRQLYLVDSYNYETKRHYPEAVENIVLPEENLKIAWKALRKLPCTFLITTSQKASELLAEIKPQFVYLDASHIYEDISNDIGYWYPILREGGILGGHDYDKDHRGVIDAVDEFTSSNSLEKNLVKDTDPGVPSWYVIKPAKSKSVEKHIV